MFYCLFIVETHKTCKFHRYFNCNFLSPKCPVTLISYTPYIKKKKKKINLFKKKKGTCFLNVTIIRSKVGPEYYSL